MSTPPAASSGAGTPLVLLHAFPLDGRMWAPQVEALAGSYQVIVPDLRGFGAAKDQAVEEAGMDLLADDLLRLLDDRGLDRVVLGGLSLGGYVALAFLRHHADRVSGLVLLDTKATADGDQARGDRLKMAERVLAEGNDFVPEVMLPKLLGETTREHRPEVVSEVAALIREQTPQAIAGAQRGMAARAATTDVLASVKVPTLVVTGEEDAVTGPGRPGPGRRHPRRPVPAGRGGGAPGQCGAAGDRERGPARLPRPPLDLRCLRHDNWSAHLVRSG
jgi:pimeloyl-ACP methyl ester carboxylesterase